MWTKNFCLLASMLLVAVLLAACDASEKCAKSDLAEKRLIVKTYDVGELWSVVDLSRGFRALFEKNGIRIGSGESIHDSAPSSMLIVRARCETHAEIAKLFDQLIGAEEKSSSD